MADVIRNAYLDLDVREAGERFLASAEFEAVEDLLPRALPGAVVVDVGAGTGIASYAFARRGVQRVYALEPDPSDEIGRGAIRVLSEGLPITVVDGIGEAIPLEDATADIVYARQVLHHADDLEALVADCARILRPAGTLLVCREHVVDDAEQLRKFLQAHPIHRYTGGEHAYPLARYLETFAAAGLVVERILGPWDSVINAFPAAGTKEELDHLGRTWLDARIGRLGRFLGSVPGVDAAIRLWLNRPLPGRLYTFLAAKPSDD